MGALPSKNVKRSVQIWVENAQPWIGCRCWIHTEDPLPPVETSSRVDQYRPQTGSCEDMPGAVKPQPKPAVQPTVPPAPVVPQVLPQVLPAEPDEPEVLPQVLPAEQDEPEPETGGFGSSVMILDDDY